MTECAEVLGDNYYRTPNGTTHNPHPLQPSISYFFSPLIFTFILFCSLYLSSHLYIFAGLAIPFGYHDVTGVLEPPGCWPLTPGFLQQFTASSRAVGPEACIGRDQSEDR